MKVLLLENPLADRIVILGCDQKTKKGERQIHLGMVRGYSVASILPVDETVAGRQQHHPDVWDYGSNKCVIRKISQSVA